MLNGAQNGIYRPLVNMAWAARCKRQPAVEAGDKIARDKWYRLELINSVGLRTTAQIAEGDFRTFEELCLHFATLSGDAGQIAYWSNAGERRALKRLEYNMHKAGVNRAYVDGIARQMGFLVAGRSIESLPEELIQKISTAVFMYSKRQRKEAVYA